MKKKVVSIIREQRNFVLRSVIGLSVACIGVSCEKQRAEDMSDALVVSINEDRSDIVSEIDLPVEGGKDTLYVFSSSDIHVTFQTGEPEDWITVDKKEYIGHIGATRVILNIQPLTDGFEIRSGILAVTNQEKYNGSFIKLSQGYETRFVEDFAWLRYGNGNPLDLFSGTLIDSWSTAQKQYGWTSTLGEHQSQAFVYGKNGYVQLGEESAGADLKSPIIPSIEQDSVLLLTFDAVSYISRDGVADDNTMTVKIVGAEFEGGGDSRTVELNHFDYQSALLVTKMWEDSRFSFKIGKLKNNPTASTIQLQFLTNTSLTSPGNRLFLDNVVLYSVARFEEVK